MNSKEAKVHIIDTINGDMNKEYFINEILPKIEKDLDRLEMLEKAFKILANKEVNLIVLKYFIEKGDGVEAYNLYYTTKERLIKEEYELLKEVIENDKRRNN